MSPRLCSRHPSAGQVGRYCAACLLEGALPTAANGPAVVGDLTVQVPLGQSHAGTVFLVRGETPSRRLLRLKRWRAQAPNAFVERFNELRRQLEQWGPSEILMPVTAWVDGAGCPAVLTEFRQGTPLLEAVSSRRLPLGLAIAGLRRLQQVVRAAHARGLTHGSLVPGNVLTGRPDEAPYLLDFGFAALVFDGLAVSAQSDLDALARIEADVRALTSPGADGP